MSMNEAGDQEWTNDSITADEQKAISALRDRGFCVVIWTPSEVEHVDIGHLEDVVIERGNCMIESCSQDQDEDQDD